MKWVILRSLVDSSLSELQERDMSSFLLAQWNFDMKLKISPHVTIVPGSTLVLALIVARFIISVLLTNCDVFILPMEAFQNWSRLFSEEETFFPTELLTAFIMELCIVLNVSEVSLRQNCACSWYSCAALQHKFP